MSREILQAQRLQCYRRLQMHEQLDHHQEMMSHLPFPAKSEKGKVYIEAFQCQG